MTKEYQEHSTTCEVCKERIAWHRKGMHYQLKHPGYKFDKVKRYGEKHGGNRYLCGICKHMTSSFLGLIRHYHLMHPEVKPSVPDIVGACDGIAHDPETLAELIGQLNERIKILRGIIQQSEGKLRLSKDELMVMTEKYNNLLRRGNKLAEHLAESQRLLSTPR